MTQKNKVGKWAETAFQFDSELYLGGDVYGINI